MKEINIDLTGHRSQRLTAELIYEAELIIPMTRGHYDCVVPSHPEARERTLLMGSFRGKGNDAHNIDDPFGGGEADYRRTRDDIAHAIAGLIEYLG